jgi:hypothetical protein
MKEFKSSISHHISLLKKVSFGKIDPQLFRKYSINPGMYEFYHTWRQGRTQQSIDLFEAHIHGLYKTFISAFDVKEEYSIEYDEKDEEVLSKVQQYQVEIKEFKGRGSDESHMYDAQNTYLVERKRGNNNISIADTKYYFVSTDQRLRKWDFGRNESQPLALLPTQWMTILLRYVSRTTDDYKSFVSFLRLKQEEPIIQEDELQAVLAGISEMTEDFDRQAAILERMAEKKFQGIIDNRSSEKSRENAAAFSKAALEGEMKEMEKAYSVSIQENEKEYEKRLSEQQLASNTQMLNDIILAINNMQFAKDPLIKVVEQRVSNLKLKLLSILIGYYGVLIFLVWKYSWNEMEPITYFLSVGGIIAAYIYLAVKGDSFNPLKYLSDKKLKIQESVFSEFNFDQNRLQALEGRKTELEQVGKELQRRMHDKK